jgi:hypothetical protein
MARTRCGKSGPGRICSLFRFTDRSVEKDEKRFIQGGPATYEFRDWVPQERNSVHPNQVQNRTRIRCEHAPDSGMIFLPLHPNQVHAKMAEWATKPSRSMI